MIAAHNLTKQFDGFTALDGVSFEVGKGEIFGIIGHNGAGKTTPLRILAGLIVPTAGELTVDGIDMSKDPLTFKKRLGYLPEESRLYENMTAESYLEFFGEIYGLKRDEIHARAARHFTDLALETGGKQIGEFSKGMKRKVAIARSLIHGPDYLVYDEMTSGLDPMTSRFIADYLWRLMREQKTIVLWAHNLYQVEAICDQVMILRRGHIVAFGTMAELREQFSSVTYSVIFSMPDGRQLPSQLVASRNEEGRLVCTTRDIRELNECSGIIADSGGKVERIESRYPSLEEMLVKIGK